MKGGKEGRRRRVICVFLKRENHRTILSLYHFEDKILVGKAGKKIN
jgi:hypothetical protein